MHPCTYLLIYLLTQMTTLHTKYPHGLNNYPLIYSKYFFVNLVHTITNFTVLLTLFLTLKHRMIPQHDLLLLGRPEPPFRTGLCFTADVFFFLFFSPRFLRDPSTDRPETLPHGRNLAEFYKLTSKIREVFP